MELYSFFETFFTALATDGDLSAWSVANFGRPVTVFPDIDSETPPDIDSDAPYIILYSPGKNASQVKPDIEYVLRCFLVLVSENRQVRAESNIIEPAGVKLISEMVTKTVAALKAALPADMTMEISVDSDTAGALPEVHGYMDVIFTEQTTIGTDPID